MSNIFLLVLKLFLFHHRVFSVLHTIHSISLKGQSMRLLPGSQDGDNVVPPAAQNEQDVLVDDHDAGARGRRGGGRRKGLGTAGP